MNQTCEHIEEQIPDALSGRLNGAALAELEAHCEICADCRALYGSFEQTTQLLERAFPVSGGHRPELWDRIESSVSAKSARMAAPRVIPAWGPIAAAAAMVALAVLLFAGSPARRTENVASVTVPPITETPREKTSKSTTPTPVAIARGPREVIDDTRGLALLRTTGPVFTFDAEHQAWRQVVSGERIAYGAALRTAPGALAELAFGESRVRVDEKSEVTVSNATVSAARVAELTHGRVRVDLLHSERPFQIRSGGGMVELTGTVVDVDAPATDLAFVQVLEGHVRVTPAANTADVAPVSVVAGQEALVASRINAALLKSLPADVQARLSAFKSSQALGRDAAANWTDSLDHPPSPKNSAIGQLIVKDEHGREAEPLRIVSMDVKTQVRGPESITRIDQSFYNSTNGTLEGTFYFNVPPGAAISRFAMYVDEKNLIEGEVVERGRARAIYESILHAKRDPALLEWVDGNTFKARVFPIQARSNKRIIMEYTQVLPAFFDTRRYVFPLVSDLAQKAEIGKLSIQVQLATGDSSSFSEIASPSYSSDLRIQGDGEAFATASLHLEHARPAADFVLNFSAPRASELYASAYAQNGEQPYLLLGYQPRLPATYKRAANAAGRDILFVVETSGARTPQDLSAQRQALTAMLAALNDNDRVAFAAADIGLVPLTTRFLPARAAEVDAALAALKQRVAMGALDLSASIRAAATSFDTSAPTRERLMLFIGSGVPALGELDSGKIAAEGAEALAKAKASFVAVSLGQSVDALTLSEVARRSNGFYLPLKADEGLDAAAFQLALGLQTPLLTSPEFKADANCTAEIYPANLGALLPGQEIFLNTRAAKTGASVLRFTLSAELQKQPFTSNFVVALPSDLSADPAAGRFWARARLDHLLAQPQSDELRNEVIELAKTWTLMSPYTSFLVLESNEEYKRYDIDRSKRRPAWRDLEAPTVAQNPGQSLIGVLTRVKGSRSGVAYEKSANAYVIRDPAAESTGLLQEGLKFFNELEYESAKPALERAVLLDPTNEVAKQKLQTVNSLLAIHVDKIGRKIRELEQGERVRQSESLVQLANAFQDGRSQEELGSKPAQETTGANKEQILADQLDHLRKAQDKFRRVTEILNWLPPSFDLPSERASVEDSLKRTKQKIAEKEDEIIYLRRVAAQKEADENRVRETELFKARIAKLTEQVKDRYYRGDYKAAERLSTRILQIDPFNTDAEGWKLKAQGAGMSLNGRNASEHPDEYVDADIDKATIGFAPIILYPSNWDQITRRVDDLTKVSRGSLAEKASIGKEYQGLDARVLFGDFGDIKNLPRVDLGTTRGEVIDPFKAPLRWDLQSQADAHREAGKRLFDSFKLADTNLESSDSRKSKQEQSEFDQLKREIEDLRKRLKTAGTNPRITYVDSVLDSKYGPNTSVTTKNGDLKIGGLTQAWHGKESDPETAARIHGVDSETGESNAEQRARMREYEKQKFSTVEKAAEDLTKAQQDDELKSYKVLNGRLDVHSEEVAEVRDNDTETTGRKEVAIAAKDNTIRQQESLLAQEKAEKETLAEQNKALAEQNLQLAEKNARIAQEQAAETMALGQKIAEQDSLLHDLGTLYSRGAMTDTKHDALEKMPESATKTPALSPELEIYDVRDLTNTIADFPGPELKLEKKEAAPPTPPTETATPPKRDIADLMAKLIDKGVPNTSIAENNGQLVVMADPVSQAKVAKALKEMREPNNSNIFETINDQLKTARNTAKSGGFGPVSSPQPKICAICNQPLFKHADPNFVCQPNADRSDQRANQELRLKFNAERDAHQEALAKLATAEHENGKLLAEDQEYIKKSTQELNDHTSVLSSPVLFQGLTKELLRTTPTDPQVRARNEKSELEYELAITNQTLSALEKDKRSVEEDLALQTSRIERLLKSGVPIARLLGEDSASDGPATASAPKTPPASAPGDVLPGFFSRAEIPLDLPQTSQRIEVTKVVPSPVPEHPASHEQPYRATFGPISNDSADIAKLKDEVNAAKQKLAQQNRDKHAIEEDLALQTSRIERLMKNGVPIAHLVGEDPTATQPFVADGQVLGVRPEIRLVMLSIGSQQGVKPGFQYTIKRGDQYVTRVIVEKVYPDMSSARYVEGLMNKEGREVEVNDEVITRGGSAPVSDDKPLAPKTAPVNLSRDQIAALLATMPKNSDVAAARAELYRKLAALSTGLDACRVLAQGLAEFQGEGTQAEQLAGDVVVLVDSESSAAVLDAMLPLLSDENLRARVLARRGAVEPDLNKRCEFLASAFEASGKEVSYLHPLAVALNTGGRHAQVIARLEASLRSGGAQNWMWPLLTVSYRAIGDAAGALRAGSQLVAQHPREAAPRMEFARALDGLGRGADAIREMRAACTFAPENVDAVRALRDLSKKYDDAETRAWALLALLRNDWGNDSQPIWADTRKELDALKADFLKAGMKDKAADLASRAREADVTDIVAVMSWNTDKTDIDLHVEEPGQQRVSYNSRSTFRGGNLDHDNTSGYGPETYTLRHAPAGRYIIKVHYYSGQPPTDVTINVTRRKGGAEETTQTFHVHLEKAHDEQIVETIDIPNGTE